MKELKMTDHNLNIADAVAADAKLKQEPPKLVKYRVAVEGGIFKNGKLYAKGEELDLQESTGERFLALGEVEKV